MLNIFSKMGDSTQYYRRYSRETPHSFFNFLIAVHCIILLSLPQEVSSSAKFQKSLYSAGDQITDIESKDFSETVYNKRKAFFIEFYSSWCGGCIAYAPTYKKFAKSIARWKPIMEVAGVNCADEANADLCRDHEIEKFPTVKYFKYGSRSEKDGEEFTGDKYELDKFVMNVAHLIAEDYRAQKPPEWPVFEHISRDKTLPALWNEKAKFIGMVVEHNTGADYLSAFGAQAILDWNGIDDMLILSATIEHRLTLGQFSEKQKNLPGVVIYKKGDPDPIYTSREGLTRERLNELLSDYTKLPPLKVQPVPNDPPSNQLPAKHNAKKPEVEPLRSPIPKNPHIVHMEDILSGLSYMLRHEVAMKKSFTSPQLEALHKFISLLNKYFPGHAPVRRLLVRLDDWLSSRPTGGLPLTGKEWITKIDDIQADLGRPLPQNTTWVSCQGSEPNYRGYPCSLWTIFHLLTVQAYKKDGQEKSFDSVDILETIHGYVKHFFGCAECVKNFEKTAVNIPEEVKKPEDVVLWLWKAHNRANGFLKDKLSVDPAFPKQQFPSKALCPTCLSNEETLEWNDWEVLAFLTRFYSKDSMKSLDKNVPYSISSFENGQGLKADRKLDLNPRFRGIGGDFKKDEKRQAEIEGLRRMENSKHSGREFDVEGSRTGFFSGMDISLCLTLWLGSIVLLGSLCLWFKYRKHKHRYWKQFEHRNA